jgi:putative (di)nucleoside polyphosphate hydrolase
MASVTSVLPYRLGVGMMILNSQNQVFVGKRPDFPDGWQMPQGGMEESESPQEAMYRELKEEIGTDKVHILSETSQWLSYDFPPPLRSEIWGGKFQGQRQKWFLLRFLGEDGEIQIQTATPEFIEWRWVMPQDLESLVVGFKKEIYRNLLREFSSFLF